MKIFNKLHKFWLKNEEPFLSGALFGLFFAGAATIIILIFYISASALTVLLQRHGVDVQLDAIDICAIVSMLYLLRWFFKT